MYYDEHNHWFIFETYCFTLHGTVLVNSNLSFSECHQSRKIPAPHKKNTFNCWILVSGSCFMQCCDLSTCSIICSFTFHVSVNWSQSQSENIKLIIPEINNWCFKLHAILSVMMKTCATLLHHVQDSQSSTFSAPDI